jgi:hypothetical protein
MSSTEFPEPPEEFLKYPAGNVIALMTDGDAVAAALDDLTGAGFPRDKMYVLAGPAGAERLDVTGQHHGLRGRLPHPRAGRRRARGTRPSCRPPGGGRAGGTGTGR